MKKILENIGLTTNEIALYEAFLKHKNKTAADIARLIHMDKSSCYRACEKLAEKELIISNPKKRGTTFTVASPKVLKELFNAKQNEMDIQSKQLDTLIQSLLTEQTQKRETYIKVEKGIQAVRDSQDKNLEAALSGNKLIREQYRLDFPYFKDPEHVAWVNRFAKRRINAGVSIRQLVDFAGQTVFGPIMKTEKRLLKEIRLMPKDMKWMHGMRLSGDFVTIISFDEKKDYIVITIRDKYVCALLTDMFDFIWARSETY